MVEITSRHTSIITAHLSIFLISCITFFSSRTNVFRFFQEFPIKMLSFPALDLPLRPVCPYIHHFSHFIPIYMQTVTCIGLRYNNQRSYILQGRRPECQHNTNLCFRLLQKTTPKDSTHVFNNWENNQYPQMIFASPLLFASTYAQVLNYCHLWPLSFIS